MLKLVSLKQHATNELKVLAAIGGSKKSDDGFSDLDVVFNNVSIRENFISSAMCFLRKYDFDGINVDWHFLREDVETNDKLHFVTLISEIRTAFENEAKESRKERMLITITIPSKESESKGFDIPKLDPNIDFYCMLTYDYHTAHERSVNHHSPLLRSTKISSCNTKANFNVESTVRMYIEKGATKSKLVLGIPLYGKCFTLENANYYTTGSPTLGPYKDEPCNQHSFVPYSKICKFVENHSWKPIRPEPCKVGPYVHGTNLIGKNAVWIGYDDEESAKRKGVYVSKHNLGGVSFWTLEYDDYKGLCTNNKFPVIRAATRGLSSKFLTCQDNPNAEQLLPTSDLINATFVPDNATAFMTFMKNRDKVYNPFKLASHNIYTGIWGAFNFLIGILGNLLTLIAIPYAAKTKKHDLHLHWYTSTIYILNLAIFDLGFCIFGMPTDILSNLGIGWPFGNTACKIFNYLGPIFAYGDWYALGLIALTRALFIVKNKEWEEFCTEKKNALSLIVASCAFNILLCVPRFYPNGKMYIYDEYSDICQYVEETSNDLSKVSFGLTLLQKIPHYMAFAITSLTIFVSYFKIWRHVRQSRKNVNHVKTNKACDKNELRLTVTLSIICIFFIICVLPLTMLEQFAGKIGYNGIISLFWAQYSINVFVYAARRDQFWKAYQDIFKFFYLPLQTMLGIKTKKIKKANFGVATKKSVLASNEKEFKLNETSNSLHNSSNANSTLVTSTRTPINNTMDNTDNHSFIDVCIKEHSENTKQMTTKTKLLNSNKKTQSSTGTKKNVPVKGTHKLVTLLLVLIPFGGVVTLFTLMFTTQKTNSKLLVLVGYTSTDDQDVCSGWLNNVEVIDLERSSECIDGLVQFSSHLSDETNYFSEEFPKRLTDSSGGLLDNVPLVCGGKNEDEETSKSCYKMISTSRWQSVADMYIERSSFASTITKHGFLVVGGLDRGSRIIDAVEILPAIHENFTSRNPFEKPISSGCMCAVDDNNAVLIGGYFYGFELTSNMWKYDIQNDLWEIMPPMKIARAKHSCTSVKDPNDGSVKIIVAGGTREGSVGTKSVEIFDMKHQTWIEGPELPFKTSLSQLIQDGIGGGALLVGGRASIDLQAKRLTSILHLSKDLREWKQLGRDMKIGRASHMAMLIPETMINCNK